MIEKTNVMIFPAGAEIAIEIFHSLRYNLHFDVYGVSGKSDHAAFLYDSDHYLEGDYYIDKPDFIENLNKIIREKNIKFIFPAHDTVALFLKENEGQLEAKVLSSDLQTATIARDKTLIYNLFSKNEFCPIVYKSPYNNIEFPVFIKPNKGQGGKGAFIAANQPEFDDIIGKTDDMVVTELLPGEELSVDCFTDRHGKLLFIGPRTRERVQIGISFRSNKQPLTADIEKIAKTINEKVKIRGTWFFQVKRDKNNIYKLLEFAVRQASTMGLFRQVGVNFALLSLFDMMDKDVEVLVNEYQITLDRCLYNRYKIEAEYDKAYIDFDDTIIVDDQVNLDAVRYIYYCKNKKIKTILLTKHRFDLDETLKNYNMSRDMFDEVIHISMEDDKTKYIDPNGSVFIDNHFPDRKKIQQALNIPVFDVDALDSLIENK
jgi:hypothetical protein